VLLAPECSNSSTAACLRRDSESPLRLSPTRAGLKKRKLTLFSQGEPVRRMRATDGPRPAPRDLGHASRGLAKQGSTRVRGQTSRR
jgi:hypothetical protein